jgi:hypothetical protein
MADIYGHEQMLDQRRALQNPVAARRADKLRGAGRPNMPLSTHTSQVAEEAGLIGHLQAIANDPQFQNSLGLMPNSDPGFVPSYGHGNSAGGYQYGDHVPNIPHGLPPQTISAPAPPQFAGAANPTHASAAAMDPAGVASAAATQRNDDTDPSRANDYATIMAGLESVMNPNTGNLTYTHGKLAEQPWFPQLVAAGQQRGAMSDEQRAAAPALPTVEHQGARELDKSFKDFQEFYGSKAQTDRRAKRQGQRPELAPENIRDTRMARASNRNHPEMNVLAHLQQIAGPGGVGPMHMAAAGLMPFDAVPGIMNAQNI